MQNEQKQIVGETGGLLISEYYTRQVILDLRWLSFGFIDRDRLQALFAKAVILIASYALHKGDSGAL